MTARHRFSRFAQALGLALALALALSGAAASPRPALAAQTAKSKAAAAAAKKKAAAAKAAAAKADAHAPTLDAAKAQQIATQAEIEAMRIKLSQNVAQYIALGRELSRTRADISDLTTQALAADAAYNASRASLTARAVEMYRSDKLGLIGVLFGAQSVDDFLARAHYLVFVSGRDASLLREVRLRRTENMWLQEGLNRREAQLVLLQQRADDDRKQIESDIALEQAKAISIGADIVQMLRVAATPRIAGGSAPSGSFDPDNVIAEAAFRNSNSMSVAQIQTFLEQQPGSLAGYVGSDHAGQQKSAAQMISEACTQWGISPKVVLATLQKEQSLLSKSSPSQNSLDWAMGCGKADSRTFYQYQGFGKQIWFGTQKLKQNADLWRPGAQLSVDGSGVHPANPGTFGQYRYTPHFPGVMSFWMIYWRYFGDPQAV